MVIFGKIEENLQENLEIIIKQWEDLKMKYNTEKKNTMIMRDECAKYNVKIEVK